MRLLLPPEAALTPLDKIEKLKQNSLKRLKILQIMKLKFPDNIDGTESVNKNTQIRNEDKIGRNDKCPCGSGQKYKNCCGKDL